MAPSEAQFRQLTEMQKLPMLPPHGLGSSGWFCAFSSPTIELSCRQNHLEGSFLDMQDSSQTIDALLA
jgi:hypothetical protein